MPEIASEVVDCYPFRHAAAGTEFLMLRRAPTCYLGGTWHAVHGGIEPVETAWQAALRELREETGLRPLRFWQLEFVNTFYLARRDRVMVCPCFAAEVALDAAVELSGEHTDYRWVPSDEAFSSFFWPGQRRAVDEILTLIIPGAPAEPYLRSALENGPGTP